MTAAVSSLLGSIGSLDPSLAALFTQQPSSSSSIPIFSSKSASDASDASDDTNAASPSPITPSNQATPSPPLDSSSSFSSPSPDADTLESPPVDENALSLPSRRDRHRDLIARNARTVFVGNLPVSVTEKKSTALLASLFALHGKIESIRFRSIAFDSKLPRKAAFIAKQFHPRRDSLNAYIVYTSKEPVDAALALNGSVFLDKHLRVDRAEKSAAEQTHDHKRSIFIGNLPFDICDEDVYKFFQDCGDIEYVRIIRDKSTNVGKGIGYVQFVDRASVSLAQKLNDTELAKRRIRISRSIPTLANRSRTTGTIGGKRVAAPVAVEGTRASRHDKIKPSIARVSKKKAPGKSTVSKKTPGGNSKTKKSALKPKAVMAKQVARAKAAVASEDRRKSFKKSK